MSDLGPLKNAAAGEDPEAAIDVVLAGVSAETIASLLAQTSATDRFLRIVLRNRLARVWPVTTDAYQAACFVLAAELQVNIIAAAPRARIAVSDFHHGGNASAF